MSTEINATPEQLQEMSDGELLDLIYEIANRDDWMELPANHNLMLIRRILNQALTTGDN